MDIVQEFAKAGYALFPLNGKIPATKADWRTTPLNPGLSILDFTGNYGIVAGSRLIIDVDCKNNQPGKASFINLSKDLGLPLGWEKDTFVVQTGTNGYHIYLNMPSGIKTRKHLKEYPGLEFLHGPFYVVGPGSVHPDTQKPYKVVFGAPGALLQANPALLELLTEPQIETAGPKPEKGFVDDDPLNIERFRDILNSMPDVPEGKRNDSVYIAACRGRDCGLSQPKTLTILEDAYNKTKLSLPLSEDELRQVVASAYKYAKQEAGSMNVSAIFKTTEVGEPIDFGKIAYDINRNKEPQKTLNNAVNYLITLPQLTDAFKFNVFSGMIEIHSSAPWYKERGSRGPNLCDEDIVLLKYLLAKTMKLEFSQQTLWEAVIVVAHKRHYHPVRNYLNSLTWDGTPRLDMWLTKYGHALDTAYTRAIGRKILCAAVKRVYEPGCKWDYVLIIEGSQGIGKSTACRILGRNWAGDMNLDPHAKDSVAMMLGKWIIELSEMTALRWADANALKSFITREKDTVRLAYERHAKDFPRQSIFIGTVNPEHVGYLNDITGNRRYWMVRFHGAVDLMGLENDCNQLWAEAKAVYMTETPYLSGEAEQLQVLEAQTRMPEDPMRGNVVRWVRENPDTLETTTDAILEYLGVPMKSINRADQSRIAQALVEMGWEKALTREHGIFATKYVRPIRDQIDILMGAGK